MILGHYTVTVQAFPSRNRQICGGAKPEQKPFFWTNKKTHAMYMTVHATSY